MHVSTTARNIVLFSDGTGNSAASANKTNVWRAYRALDTSAGTNQLSYYDDGVGTSRFRPKEVMGLTTGWGLARNVKNIYAFLCRSYRPGDQIYGFGFSRGAYTIRVVMAMVACEGLINRSNVDEQTFNKRVNQAFKSFRQKSFTASFLSFPWRIISSSAYEDSDNIHVKIRFMGVWDTVDAYGLPIDELRRAWDMVVWPLTGRDRDCPSNIEQACHALALDEQRLSFSPTLWNERPTKHDATQPRINQVWFPGVHANIGGGYPDDTLALVSLQWMLKQAGTEGLIFKESSLAEINQNANCHGPIADSRSGIGFIYRLDPRHVENLCRQKSPGLANWLKKRIEQIFPKNTKKLTSFAENKLPRLANNIHEIEENVIHIETPKIHRSVLDRIAEPASNYAPLNLPGNYDVVDDNNLVLPSYLDALIPNRRAAQSSQWNLIGLRKVIYAANFLLITGVVFYTLSSISIPTLLNWGSWPASLGKNIAVLVPIVVVLVLLKYGGWLKSTLNNNLLKIWHSGKNYNQTEKSKIKKQSDRALINRGWLDNYIDSRSEMVVSPGMKVIRGLKILLETTAVVTLLVAIGYSAFWILGGLLALITPK